MRPTTSILGLGLLAAGAAAAAGQTSAARPTNGALFQPPAQVAYDEPGDGLLWARGVTYKASFGPEGASYIPFLGSQAPRNYPVRMRLASARVGERELALTERASWSRAGDRVVLERGLVDVVYRLEPEAVEQLFRVDPLVPDGDLVVELEVESELELRAAGAGFELAGEHGGVRYGGATVIDAEGRSLALESRQVERGLSIRVPREWLASAAQPVVIDPVITTYAVNPGANDTYSGDVAYDATHGLFLHVYTVFFSLADYDVYSVPVQLDGTVRHDLGLWIDVSDVLWGDISVANSNADDNFLVVGVAQYTGIGGIYGRLRQLPGLGIGPLLQISEVFAPRCGPPSVGGETIEGGSSRYCVAWREGETDDRAVRYRILDSTGANETPVVTLEGPGLSVDHVRVSDSNGYGLSGERCWNLVWTRTEQTLDSDIRGAQIAPNGVLKTAPFLVDGRSISHYRPDVSSPLLAPSGGPRDFLAVYEGLDGDYEVYARLLKGDQHVGSWELGQLEADALGDGSHLPLSRSWPKIATDGTQFLVVYEEKESLLDDSVVRLTTLHHNGDDLFVGEARLLVGGGPGESHSVPDVASAHDAGVVGAPVAALTWGRDQDTDDGDTLGALYLRPAGWKPLGEVVCAGIPNSTGAAGTFRAYGSDLPGDDRLFLDADNLPPFQWGQFLMSQNQATLPYGDGFLCLGAPHVRLNSTKQNSWIRGAAGSQLDLTALPQGTVFQPGDTWYFQFWHRDGSSFNFSNALGITFQ